MLSKEFKSSIYKRANGLCKYCKSPADISAQPFSIDHIIPKSQGGQMNTENLALCCQGCNNHKYNKTEAIDLMTGQITKLFNPREQKWKGNF
jgi:5-methylcytosine-specific restriction endonuclease McrA